MTRYTSLAYKRSHHDAGFVEDEEPAAPAPDLEPSAPPKKKRKVDSTAIEEAPPAQRGWGRDPKVRELAAKSEQRRQKRIQERMENTTCFACRRKGHAAADCPDSNLVLDNARDEDGPGEAARPATGICYRCGSTYHSLKKCRKPANPDNPLPFATCFVCKNKGHLAGQCGKNEKGVYPRGGSCVLCGKKTHLAKDCEMRTQPVADASVMTVTKKIAADEDDFHTFKRKQMRVERVLKDSEKRDKRKGAAPTAVTVAAKPKPKVVAF